NSTAAESTSKARSVREPPSPSGCPSSAKPPPFPTPNLTMKKILIIEDEPEMRRNLLMILKLEKFQPLGAENGSVGLSLARREKPDLILCDVMMPELDGYGVLNALREDPELAATPFIFLTAKGEKTDQRCGMNLGADDYLTKPVARADLLNAISSRLRRSEQTAQQEF